MSAVALTERVCDRFFFCGKTSTHTTIKVHGVDEVYEVGPLFPLLFLASSSFPGICLTDKSRREESEELREVCVSCCVWQLVTSVFVVGGRF